MTIMYSVESSHESSLYTKIITTIKERMASDIIRTHVPVELTKNTSFVIPSSICRETTTSNEKFMLVTWVNNVGYQIYINKDTGAVNVYHWNATGVDFTPDMAKPLKTFASIDEFVSRLTMYMTNLYNHMMKHVTNTKQLIGFSNWSGEFDEMFMWFNQPVNGSTFKVVDVAQTFGMDFILKSI